MNPFEKDEASCGRMEVVPTRALRLLGPVMAGHESSSLESGQQGHGPPNQHDRLLIARKLLASNWAAQDGGLAGRDRAGEADMVAQRLVQQASAAMQRLVGDGATASLSIAQVMALESVMHVRGRPSLRIEDNSIESLTEAKHPGSGIWRLFLTQHETALVTSAAAAGAVVVKDNYSSRPHWVQGTVWLIRPDLAITNRHVLFPPQGLRLARRRPEQLTAARLKSDVTVTLDFALDNGTKRDIGYRIQEILFVSQESDPIDIAVLQVERIVNPAQPSPTPLHVVDATVDEWDMNRIFVIGHPGKVQAVPSDVAAVFGDPDELKRVSFGELLDPDPQRTQDLVYDASTIGGFSGGCVLGFHDSPRVVALHYWGDPTRGNRAIMATALRAHAVNQILKI